MDYVAAITEIEARLKRDRKHVADLLRRADVAASQWQRWKAGNQKPHRTTWGRIVVAATEMAVLDEAAA